MVTGPGLANPMSDRRVDCRETNKTLRNFQKNAKQSDFSLVSKAQYSLMRENTIQGIIHKTKQNRFCGLLQFETMFDFQLFFSPSFFKFPLEHSN